MLAMSSQQDALPHVQTAETSAATPAATGRPERSAEGCPVPSSWNDTGVVYPEAGLALHQLIERQAARTPAQVALVFEDQRLCYGELEHRANQLAHHLIASGARAETPVGLFVERSLEMVVGMLAILKTGAPYLPIDAATPQERLEFMLADAEVGLLLTQDGFAERLADCSAHKIFLDSFAWSDPEAPAPGAAAVRPGNLAYVIYTSGSTGRPKAVGIEHRNIVNYVLGVAERFRFRSGMNHATVSTIAADLGNTVIFPALTTGGCLHVIAPERTTNQGLLAEYFEREHIDVLKIVPSHLAALQSGSHPERVMPRERLILGGEASHLEWIEQLRRMAPHCAISNHYGPTETTVGVLTYDVGAPLPKTQTGTLPLGRPLPNSRIYVLDEFGQPVPVGATGELCIGGHGVARGYLGRPQLTAEKFIDDPFSPDPGARLYRSGDLARWLPDGDVEFCGRIDRQVKIHGYRVELGEIEATLRSHRGVQNAAVVAREDEAGVAQVVAYVVPRRPNQPLWDSSELYVLPDGQPVAHLNRNETAYIYHEIFVLQAYLRHGITIEDGDCIVDAGANIGLFSVFANRLARQLRVYSLEPNPAAFACLKANTAAWEGSVKCLPIGLSYENKSAELTFFEGLSLLSGFYADAAVEREMVKNYVTNQQTEAELGDASLAAELGELIDDRLQSKTVTARLKTLSTVIAEEGIQRIDLLKINVEKSELDVLRGIEPEDWPKIRQLVIEVDLSENLQPILTLLEEQGYDTLVEQDPLLRSTELCYVYAMRPGPGRRLTRQQGADTHKRELQAIDGEIVTQMTLRNYLDERLPAYMVPAAFIRMDRLPLNANGKTDLQALPPWLGGPGRLARTSAPARPRTETEQVIAAIWEDLLKVDQIGLDDDFFDLGGQSLMAIRVVSRIRDAFAVDLRTQAFFANPTISALARMVTDAMNADQKAHHIERRTETGPCPLSLAQEEIWFVDQLTPDSPAYNVVDYVSVGGLYDAGAMQRALGELVHRHESLRTVFRVRNGQPMQLALPRLDVSLSEYDLRTQPEGDRELAWIRLVHEQSRQAFALSEAPLFRAVVVHMSAHEHRLLLTVHHIVADEWSMELVQQEIHQLYEAFAQGRKSPLPPLPIQYADFARWQRSTFRGAIRQAQIDYWRQELADAPGNLEFPTDKPRPPVPTFAGAVESFEVPKALMTRLNTLARQEQATLFMVLLSSFMVFLHRHSGKDDLLVGTPITRRMQAETEKLIGYFLNTLVLRACFTEQTSFRALLRQVRQRALGAYAHADLPFNQLVAELAPERIPGQTPLIQTMFVLHDVDGVSQVSKVSGNCELATGTAKFDLSLIFSETAGRLEGMIEYRTDLFEAATVRRMCAHYLTLLTAIAGDADRLVSRLPLLSDIERHVLREDWNHVAVANPGSDLCLHQLIDAQAMRTPHAVALAVDDQSLTYAELNRRANQLARFLRDLGVGPEVPVGVFMERSPEMVVGLLAILKAGGAYVPLDPAYPAQRLAGIIEDAGATLLLTEDALTGRLPAHTARVVSIDGMRREIMRYDSGDLPRSGSPENLAYVIFTSGSTGRPKGVAVTHRSLVNLLESMGREPGLDASDVLLSVTTLSFDIAALELFLPLIKGARVTLVSRDESLDARRLMARLSSSGATVMQATPATWRLLLDAGWEGSPGLKVLCGGEALTRDLADRLLDRAAEVWNLYGPTETTVWSSAWRVESGPEPISIGRPIANTQIWVLDRHGEPVPVGVPGELCIGGAGVARGYWNRPDLTAERFVPDRLSGATGGRLYRTGDWARWLPDGRLECLGRMDHQVKIRGYRIEPGEIEACIARHPAVRAVVVAARDDHAGHEGSEKRLVAYLTADDPPDDLFDELRALVRAAMPEYMLPAHFVLLDALPLTHNGKVDRKALPEPSYARLETVRPYVGPRTPTEKAVAAIWASVLGATQVSIEDNFFDMGGHSIKAVQVIAALRSTFGVDAAMRHLFEQPTIAGLAAIVDVLAVAAHREEPSAGGPREEFEI